MNAVAVVLAAGRGERLGERVPPKAFVRVGGRPLLAFSLDAVERCPDVMGVVVAVPPGLEDAAADVLGRPPATRSVVVVGGMNRQRSVRLALDAAGTEWGDEFDAVICHDAARPFASSSLFSRVLGALAHADGAVPAVPVEDTLKRVRDGGVGETVPRDGLVRAQTPQAFRRKALESAHRSAERDAFQATDDAALLERAGFRVTVVDGDPRNIKITRPEDLALAEALARADG
jgi:2-C-methyl-D-erythritol 4-phosphate cytidylyltransferase / 2-C-methyl-D-erythritol 2,4-cyclodiphosphate synthase